MSLKILFLDELRGFYRSKVMLVLWLGLPVLGAILFLWGPDTGDEIPFTVLSALLLSSIGGTLASVMLAVSIINEKEKRVYDLFLIRPIRRGDILISKFLAVYLCIAIAGMLALALGVSIDYYRMGGTPEAVSEHLLESVVLTLSMMAMASAAGVLIGVISPTVLVGAVIVIYGGNQISVLPVLPELLGYESNLALSVIISGVTTAVLMGLSVFIFNRKQF